MRAGEGCTYEDAVEGVVGVDEEREHRAEIRMLQLRAEWTAHLLPECVGLLRVAGQRHGHRVEARLARCNMHMYARHTQTLTHLLPERVSLLRVAGQRHGHRVEARLNRCNRAVRM